MKLRSHLAFQNKLTKSPIDGQVTELIVFSSSELQTWDHMIHSYKSCFRIPIGMGAPRWDNSYTQVSFVWVSHTKYIFFIDLKSYLVGRNILWCWIIECLMSGVGGSSSVISTGFAGFGQAPGFGLWRTVNGVTKLETILTCRNNAIIQRFAFQHVRHVQNSSPPVHHRKVSCGRYFTRCWILFCPIASYINRQCRVKWASQGLLRIWIYHLASAKHERCKQQHETPRLRVSRPERHKRIVINLYGPELHTKLLTCY